MTTRISSVSSKSAMSVSNHDDVSLHHPNPYQFEEFLPWACRQFTSIRVVNVVINAGRLDEVKSPDKSTKTKEIQCNREIVSAIINLTNQSNKQITDLETIDEINIQALYDVNDHLTNIEINNNKHVPRHIIQIMQLIIEYQPFLKSLTVNRGVDKVIIYEISKLIPMSNITQLGLDNTVLKEANYYILLDNPSKLNYLSLSKCNINDDVIQKIAERLEYPRPASKTLSILYLSMNRITDVGVGSLAKALRSNRKLSYLNLAGNMISDDGANALLDALLEFPLTPHEITESRARHLEVLKSIESTTSKLSMIVLKSLKKPTHKRGTEKSIHLSESIHWKAVEHVKGIYGEQFTELFITDIVEKNETIHCIGNNTLAYISLAYNNVSQCTLKKIVQVLTYQSSLKRTPRGLVNLNVQGNPFDEIAANYLFMIDSMISDGLAIGSQYKAVPSKKLKLGLTK